MEPIHRLSMNTSLKNARIFDDDAWDEDDCPIIKRESKEDFVATSVQGRAKIHLNKIREESEEESDDTFEEGELANSFCNKSIKQEMGSTKEHDDIFEEGDCDHTFREGKCTSSFNDKFVEQEPSPQMSRSHDDTVEEGEWEKSFCETKHLPHHEESYGSSSEEELAGTFHDDSIGKAKFKCKTPPPPMISYESYSNSSEEELAGTFHDDSIGKAKFKCKTPPPPIISYDPDTSIDRMFDESPYNKEMFKTLKIKEETPNKTENEESSRADLRNSLKSAKRTVFSRPSPYKKVDNNSHETRRFSAKSHIGEDYEDNSARFRRYRKNDLETDPAVLARREKQIEYGKNTIGYENYIRTVPKLERKLDDPQTPPKIIKYSRRGWEGLIKQWRIKLHRFDPPDNDAS